MKIRIYLSPDNDFKFWNDDFGLTHIGYPEWWLNEAFQNLNKEDYNAPK